MLIEEVMLFEEQNRCFFKALAWYNEAEIAGNRVKMLFFMHHKWTTTFFL